MERASYAELLEPSRPTRRSQLTDGYDVNLTPLPPNPATSLPDTTKPHKNLQHPPSKPEVLNDAQINRDRRVESNSRSRHAFELMCECKASRFKLEEVHSSITSSSKSTFIMTFSPDGRKVASTHGDHRIYICDLNTGKLLDTLIGHPKTPWCLAWHPCNMDILASGCLAGQVRVWDLKTKACEIWNSENDTIITSIDFHPTERVLAIATANEINFWDWSQSAPFAKSITFHEKEKVKYVMFDSTGTKLITAVVNLPDLCVYSEKSLRNRPLGGSSPNKANLHQSHSDNMTQTSENGIPLRGAPNTLYLQREWIHKIFGEKDPRQTKFELRCTLALWKVASMYREFESFEDHARLYSLTPYIDSRTISPISYAPNSDNLSRSSPRIDSSIGSGPNSGPTNPETNSSPNNTHQHEPHPPQQGNEPPSTSQSSVLTPFFEPLVLSFDESLRNLQLTPLVVNGQIINLGTVIEQYPIAATNQWHFIMQLDCIRESNQNFIRISKLMDSARLYRQLVQQITSTTDVQPYQNTLTVQLATPRTPGPANSLPMIVRNVPIPNCPYRNNRLGGPADRLVAIEFRPIARNVSLATVCRAHLLSARAECAKNVQSEIEKLIEERELPPNYHQDTMWDPIVQENLPNIVGTMADIPRLTSSISDLCCSLSSYQEPMFSMNVLQTVLRARHTIDGIWVELLKMIQTPEEGRRLYNLTHKTANSLTGRSWILGLGTTLNDLKLDVIHTFCVIDLSLHLVRQVQFLLIQRLSAVARIEESRELASREDSEIHVDQLVSKQEVQNNTSQEPSQSSGPKPGTSRESETPSTSDMTGWKRMWIETEELSLKRLAKSRGRLKPWSHIALPQSDSNMIDSKTTSSEINSINDNNTPSSSNRNDPSDGPANDTSTCHATHLAAGLPVQTSSPSTGHETSTPLNSNPTPLAINDGFGLTDEYMEHVYETKATLRGIYGTRTVDQLIGNVRDFQRALGYFYNLHQTSQDEIRRLSSSQHTLNAQIVPIRSVNSSSSDNEAPSTRQPSSTNDYHDQQQHRTNEVSGQQSRSIAHNWLHDLRFHQAPAPRQHLWHNWNRPVVANNFEHRIQCWKFSVSNIPEIKNPLQNLLTYWSRIHNNSSIDVSSNGLLLACLVPCEPLQLTSPIELKVYSLSSSDFGNCYYHLRHGSDAASVSLSPTGNYVIVGYTYIRSLMTSDPAENEVAIASVHKLNRNNSPGFIRDITIKKTPWVQNLNAIRWMQRGIVYNVGPKQNQRYYSTIVRAHYLL